MVESRTRRLSSPNPAPLAPGPSSEVLVVDDEPLIRETLAEYLKQEGFRVTACAAAEDARWYLKVDNDVVLNDEQRIESLTSVFSPQAARSVQFAPVQAQSEVLDAPTLGGIVLSALLLCVGFGGGAATVVFLSRRRQHAPSPARFSARAGRLIG